MSGAVSRLRANLSLARVHDRARVYVRCPGASYRGSATVPAMPLLIQHKLSIAGGVPKDDIVNTFTVAGNTTALTQPEIIGCCQAVADFFRATGPNHAITLASIMSREIDGGADRTVVKAYDITPVLSGGMMGSPIATYTYGFPTVQGGSSLPRELAAVLRFETALRNVSPVEGADNIALGPPDAGTKRDRPKSRETGRVYIGPLNFAVLANNLDSSINTTLRDTATGAGLDLYNALKAISPANILGLGVWSRQSGKVSPVAHFYMDNAMDVIRKRGPKATTGTRRTVGG